MAVSEENNLLFSSDVEDDCSSIGEEDYSIDSELELGDLNSSSTSDEHDESHSSTEFNRDAVHGYIGSTRSISITNNSSSFRTFQADEPQLYNHPNVRLNYNVVNRDIVDEGLRLYLMFLQQEIARNRLQAPDYLNRQNNRTMPRHIQSLTALADQFSTSAQRQWIRQQAQIVPLHLLNFQSFTDLLVGLFQEGGVTWERILVLFFFCTDISIRALQEQLMNQFQRIQNWTTRFIQETVCRWVEREGGWGVVFQQSLNHVTKIAILGFCCVGIIALCIYIRNNAVK